MLALSLPKCRQAAGKKGRAVTVPQPPTSPAVAGEKSLIQHNWARPPLAKAGLGVADLPKGAVNRSAG